MSEARDASPQSAFSRLSRSGGEPEVALRVPTPRHAANSSGRKNLPVWVVAVAILVWGWGAGLLPLAGGMAVIALLPLLLPHRFAFDRAEFHRVLDVCWVLGLGGLLLTYSRESVGNVLRTFVQWLPVVALPAWLAQVWSVAGRVPTAALLPLPSWRRRDSHLNPDHDLGPALVVLCLFASSVAFANPWFQLALSAVLGLMLWVQRSRGFNPAPAIILLCLMCAGGWFVARSLVGLQQWIETGVFLWANQAHRESGAARESRTAIGRDGRVGGSSRIVLKISNEGTRPMPTLLRIASYSEWRADSRWVAPPGLFEKVPQATEDWILDPNPSLAGAVQIQWARGSTDDLVPLPGNTVTLRGLVANNVERSALGAVRVDARPRVLSFSAEHATLNSWEEEPIPADHDAIPATERPVIDAVASELELDKLTPEEVVRRLREFFIREFRYTTRLVDKPADDPRAVTPLGRFLLGHRTGHCEYFATAAALLLRAAGIPARYTTGYLIDPFQAEGDVLTVREADAHAWVRVFIDGKWRDFDPTPPSDLADAAEARGWFGRLKRRLSELRFAIASWWWLGEKRILGQVHWLALPLLGGLLWRLRRLRTTRSNGIGLPLNVARPSGHGLDSEWFMVEERLARRGWERRHRESSTAWRQRLQSAGWVAEDLGAAFRAWQLHERLRFDPQGLDPVERADLRRLAHEVLQRAERVGSAFRPAAHSAEL